MKVLLSVKPEFAEKILNGEKRYEFRKQAFAQPVDTVVLYACRPIKMIVGEFRLKAVLRGTPEKIWRQTKHFAGINKEFFDLYYKNKNTAYALEVENVKRYLKSLKPDEFINNFKAPQSFRYIDCAKK